MRVRGRSLLVAGALGTAVLAGACGGDGGSSAATTTTAPPALADAVAATRAAPVYAFTVRSRERDPAALPLVVAGRATGDGARYQVMVGVGQGLAAVAGDGTRLEIRASGRCRVDDLAEVEPAAVGTPVGAADPEAVLLLLDAADDVRHDVVRGRDRWRATIPAAAVTGAAVAEDPTRVARMVGALDPDDDIEVTAVAPRGEGLAEVRLVLPGRRVRVLLGPVDVPPHEVTSPTGCWPDGRVWSSLEEVLVALQTDCAQLQADWAADLGAFPPELADYVRETFHTNNSCAGVFDR